MKYIKKFNTFLLKENKTDKILYHASPYIFADFKDTDTFFSETKEFAIDYSNQKSFDSGLDNEPNLYTVQLHCEIFDINNKTDYDKLNHILPEKVSYYYNDFGFSGEVPKEDLLYNMKGFELITPDEKISKLNVGDNFPDPSYEIDKLLIIKKDDNYIYTTNLRHYKDKIESVFRNTYDPSYSSLNGDFKVREIFKPVINLTKDYINDIIENDKTKSIYGDGIVIYRNIISDSPKIDKSFLKKWNDLYKECEEKYRNYLIDKEYYSKFHIKETVVPLHDTWRFYENETIIEAIKKLNYKGYVAKEKNVKTYNIFDPKINVSIIEYEFPEGYKFKSIEEYRDFKRFYEESYKKDKISRYDAYMLWLKK